MTRVELYRDGDYRHRTGLLGATYAGGKWRWRFVSNGRVMADSGQGYSRRIDCLRGCAAVLGAKVRYRDLTQPQRRLGFERRDRDEAELLFRNKPDGPGCPLHGYEHIPVVDLTRSQP